MEDSNTALFNIIEQSNSKVISLQVISFLIALEISYWSLNSTSLSYYFITSVGIIHPYRVSLVPFRFYIFDSNIHLAAHC